MLLLGAVALLATSIAAPARGRAADAVKKCSYHEHGELTRDDEERGITSDSLRVRRDVGGACVLMRARPPHFHPPPTPTDSLSTPCEPEQTSYLFFEIRKRTLQPPVKCALVCWYVGIFQLHSPQLLSMCSLALVRCFFFPPEKKGHLYIFNLAYAIINVPTTIFGCRPSHVHTRTEQPRRCGRVHGADARTRAGKHLL